MFPQQSARAQTARPTYSAIAPSTIGERSLRGLHRLHYCPRVPGPEVAACPGRAVVLSARLARSARSHPLRDDRRVGGRDQGRPHRPPLYGLRQSVGAEGLVMLNLFAFRATSPRDMKAAGDPVGPLNDAALLRETNREGAVILCAWGAGTPGPQRGGGRGATGCRPASVPPRDHEGRLAQAPTLHARRPDAAAVRPGAGRVTARTPNLDGDRNRMRYTPSVVGGAARHMPPGACPTLPPVAPGQPRSSSEE